MHLDEVPGGSVSLGELRFLPKTQLAIHPDLPHLVDDRDQVGVLTRLIYCLLRDLLQVAFENIRFFLVANIWSINWLVDFENDFEELKQLELIFILLEFLSDQEQRFAFAHYSILLEILKFSLSQLGRFIFILIVDQFGHAFSLRAS